MKKPLLSLAALCMLATACNNTTGELSIDQLNDSIASCEAPLMNALEASSADTAKCAQLISLYTQFADRFPDDTLAPVYLHRAAQLSMSQDRIDDMAAYYDRVIDNYPDYGKLDECYYEKGILLDNAGRKDEARKAYMEFLDTYPDHFLADDIRKALPLLDMSDELLLKHLNEIEH